jgi:hypothetical protein
MNSLVRTGQAQQFDAGEIHDFKATMPLLSQLRLVAGEFALTVRSASATRPMPLRLSFIGEKDRVTYEMLDFYLMRAGTEEMEISTRNDDLPFVLRVVFSTLTKATSKCSVNIKKRFAGKDVLKVQKAINALRILEAGGEIEFYSLEHKKALGVLRVPPFEFGIPLQNVVWIGMLASISEKFGVSIKLPETGLISQQEEESVSLLYALATGGALPMDDITMTSVKSVENSKMLPEVLRDAPPLTVVYRSATFKLFGTEIYLGGCAMHLDKWEFKHPDRILLDFEKAEIGEGVAQSIRPLVPVRWFLTSQEGSPSKT